MRKEWIVLLLSATVVFTTPVLAQKDAPLRPVLTIPLSGVEGRIDHLAADVKGQRLFIAALGNNTLEVIDLRAGKRVRTLQGLHEPQGVAFVPEVDCLFVANGQGTGCDVFDGSTFKSLHSVALGDDSDNVRYDSVAKRILVGYGSGALGWIEAATGKHLGDIAFKGHPESFQLEKSGPRIFVNVPSAGHIAVIDRVQNKVLATWLLSGARANFPMALDEENHRLLIGCRDPARVLVYDTQSGHVVTSFDIAGDTDDLFYDAARKRLYVSCGAGYLDVFQQKDSDHYAAIAHLPTAAGARTSLFVPQLGRLYLAVPHRGSQEAQIRVFAVEP